ncbi:MAG: dephospho-CoA kinase [Clostridia bacterium]|nr:dephospho-CoA kinase [Clostridia bacterium]
MKLIGLTGTSGSGKGFVAALFAERGIDSIDTDSVVHRLYREDAECIAALETAFGPLQDGSGAIDRRRLAGIVFANKEKLSALNAIVHRFVKREVERICREKELTGCRFLLLDAPQLYEAGMESVCYRVIAVTAPESLRLNRICGRDHIDCVSAEQRIRNQHSDAFFEARADFVIRNDGIASVEAQVDRIMGELEYD